MGTTDLKLPSCGEISLSFFLLLINYKYFVNVANGHNQNIRHKMTAVQPLGVSVENVPAIVPARLVPTYNKLHAR